MSAEGLLDFVLLSKYEICSVLWGGLKLEGSNFVSLWPRRWISFEIEGQYHVRPSIDIFSTCGQCLLNVMGKLGSLKVYESAKGLLDFVLLSKYEICSVFWGGLKLEGSHFVSLWPRRWISFETEGQYHFRPSPDICSTCGDIVGVSQIVSPQSLNTCVSWGSFRFCVHRRKFRSETSDNMDSWKAEVRRVRREKIRRKKMQVREKVGTSRNTVFFQWFVAPEGRKVGSLKRRVRSELARSEMKNCTPLWREAHFQVKMYKTHHCRTTFGSCDVEKSARRCGAKHISKSKCTKHTIVGPLLEVAMSKKCTPLWREAHFQVKMYKTHHARTTFGSCDVEKVHAVVARSTFPSQNVQNTPCSDHFWKLRCRKSARRCGTKHISKSKCTKHTMLGPLLEVAMSKKCTLLWREAHFEVKSVKNWGFWAFFDIKMSKK